VEENAFPDRPSAVRASDADREAAVARLQIAVGEGRIDLDEFAQRADAAYAAVTAAELGVLLEDLPTTTSPSAEIIGTRRLDARRRPHDRARAGAASGGDAGGRRPGQDSVRRSAPARPGAGELTEPLPPPPL
jgi:hypothetical protein